MNIDVRIRAARTARRWSQQKLGDELSLARWGEPGYRDRQQVY